MTRARAMISESPGVMLGALRADVGVARKCPIYVMGRARPQKVGCSELVRVTRLLAGLFARVTLLRWIGRDPPVSKPSSHPARSTQKPAYGNLLLVVTY